MHSVGEIPYYQGRWLSDLGSPWQDQAVGVSSYSSLSKSGYNSSGPVWAEDSSAGAAARRAMGARVGGYGGVQS